LPGGSTFPKHSSFSKPKVADLQKKIFRLRIQLDQSSSVAENANEDHRISLSLVHFKYILMSMMLKIFQCLCESFPRLMEEFSALFQKLN